MRIENQFTIPVAVSDAWHVLLDVERIASCFPGAVVDRIDGDEFAGRVKVKLGPIQLAYAGTGRFVDRDEAARRMRKGYYGASIMPVAVIEELCARLPELALFNFYGQTEMSALALVLDPEDAVRKAGSAGRPVLNCETRLVDALGAPVPPGVEGEIVHRSPHATLGYWRDPDKTAEAFRGGWFHSGDLGIADDEGYITVVDRIKDVIKSGGENVASREVEEVLYQHRAVAEVAVFGVPHPRWVESVVAAVVLRDGHAPTPTTSPPSAADGSPASRHRSTWSSSTRFPRTPAARYSSGSFATSTRTRSTSISSRPSTSTTAVDRDLWC